jgi:hypothetical protein
VTHAAGTFIRTAAGAGNIERVEWCIAREPAHRDVLATAAAFSGQVKVLERCLAHDTELRHAWVMLAALQGNKSNGAQPGGWRREKSHGLSSHCHACLGWSAAGAQVGSRYLPKESPARSTDPPECNLDSGWHQRGAEEEA